MTLIESETQNRPESRCRRCTGGSTRDQRASLVDLFGPTYLRRTLVVWAIWFAAYFVNYGLVIWLPTIYRTVYKLPLDVSLRYGLITQGVGLPGALICALTIDYVGRRIWFALAFAGASVSLGMLATIAEPDRDQCSTYMTVAYFFVSTTTRRLPLYAGALSDARARARRRHRHRLAALRLDDRADRGRLYDAGGLQSVFLTFAVVAALAAIITVVFAVETKGRVLEEVSP